MSIAEFVSDLRKLDVRLSVNGRRLRVNAPKGVLTDSLRAQIAERKQELLQFLSDYEQSAALIPPPILRRTSSGPAPLSFAQERLWFLEQLEPGSGVYNICRASRLIGQLNVSALKSSLAEILRRHEILRSQIRIVDGRPVQVIVAVPNFELLVIDLRSLVETERDREMQDRIKAEAGRHFDFSAGSFLRALLLQVTDDQHILVLTTHHIVSDAWSMGILTRELWTLYDAYAAGKSSTFKDLPVQYTDYAAWQREWLQGDVLESQLSYWKEQLKELPILNLPTDHSRPAKQSFRGARQSLSLPESLTKAVNELSGREGVTQFMMLLAAFQVLLYRYSGQEDVVVGSPISNRSRTETEGLIGFFVNTLVLRGNLSEKPTFKELLQRVRNVCLEAYAHQDLPFEKLVEELRPERDLSRNPIFQVIFVLQNTPRPLPQTAGLSIERVDVLPATSLFDLSLYLRERDGKLIGFVEYGTDLFDSSTIARMTGHFETLLEGIVADPEQPISTLPLLTEAERHQLLVEWNETEADYPKDSCIHELFEEQVERTPDATAIQFEGKQLTYRELNSRANQLAHYLRGFGVGPERLVGICVERSLEMVVGLLGILKAGGAYVPLDPAYPRERLTFMLQDSQVSVLLTQQSTIEDGRWRIEDGDSRSSILDPQMKMICLDRDWEEIAEQSEGNFDSGATAQNLAYVIYTSGSTGKPKGVQVFHRSVLNCLHSVRQRVELTENDVFLAATSISFDIAALEFYIPLIIGARAVLASRDEVLDGKQLNDRLTKCGATVMQATPSGWKLLLDAGWRSSRNFKILCGGEVLSRRLADQLLEGGGSVWNFYGPTETTIWSSIAKVEPSESPIRIGRPIANTQIYILDSHLQPVPVGVPGELHIGGDGLARRYLNQPELTVEKFVASPFGSEPGARLYRTGDCARYLTDGNIEFLGRVDNQVKIRGYRIELGEIEAVIRLHPAVREALVVAQDDVAQERYGSNNQKSKIETPKSDTRLIAYFVPTEGSPSPSELHGFLKKKFPEFMLPSFLVPLENLPLTPNGKIDPRALPAPEEGRPGITYGFVEPRTEIEELVGQIWREVLKTEKVGVHDNFFDVGGHSLLAARVITRVREIFQRDVSLREIFDAPTISALGRIIKKSVSGKREINLPPIFRVPRDRAFPLSLGQKQVWALDQLFPGTLFLNMPYSYRLVGPLDLRALNRSVQEIVKRHEAFRMVFKEQKGRPIQSVGAIPRVEIPVINLQHLAQGEAEEECNRLSIEDAELPFDLEVGPPFRFRLVRLSGHNHLFLVTVHHIVCDHWSMQVFRRELIVLYEAYVNGRPSPLVQVQFQLVDYVHWQKDLSRRRLLKTQLAYWKKKLASTPPRLEFQNQRRGRRRLGFGTVTRVIETNETLLTEIKALARKENCTTFMVLVAAISVLLYAHTGRSNIRIGTTVGNRGRPETETLIANCLNVVILSVNLSPEMTFKQLVEQVRETVLEALANQELPFGQLARALAKQKAPTKNAPLFQVMLIYQNRIFESLEAAGLTFASWEGRYRRAEQNVLLTPLDLIFDLREMATTLTGSVTYKTTSIKSEVVSKMKEWFEQTMGLLIRRPDRSLASIQADSRAEIL